MNEEARFRAAVPKSWRAVFKVAEFIHRAGGRSIYIPPLVVREEFDQREGCGDYEDIRVGVNGKEIRVEVKWRTLAFTGFHDYPYPTVLIDRMEKIGADHADYYFIANRDLTHACRISGETRKHWIGPVKRKDRDKGYEFDGIECPLDHVHFVKL